MEKQYPFYEPAREQMRQELIDNVAAAIASFGNEHPVTYTVLIEGWKLHEPTQCCWTLTDPDGKEFQLSSVPGYCVHGFDAPNGDVLMIAGYVVDLITAIRFFKGE